MMKQLIQSWISLPLWVNLWVWLILVPINIAPFFFLDTDMGYYGAWAAGFVAVVNGILMFANWGPSKVLAIPHLIACVPLLAYIEYRYFLGSGFAANSAEAKLALALFIGNGISLVFDVYDSREWLSGNRGIPGFPDAPVKF